MSGTDRLHVDLGTGLGGWTEPFRDAPGWRSVGIDIRDDLEADVIGNIRQLPLDCSPMLLTMSPPCTDFARWMLPWLHEPNPDLSLVRACLDAVEELDPTWWVLENSRGLSMYWSEADQNVGPYYLWGNLPPVDVTLTDGGKMRTSGENPEERAKIPYELADGVRRAVEGQRKLVTDGGTVEDDSDRPTVTVKWWAMGGLRSEEVELADIESVDVSSTPGSKNPFELRIDGGVFPHHCFALEWPENAVIPSTGSEHIDEGEEDDA